MGEQTSAIGQQRTITNEFQIGSNMNQSKPDLKITLSKDEALVLSEFFARFESDSEFVLRNNAEFLAFSRISAQIEKELIEPFEQDYQVVLQAARARLAEGYEGLAPGVKP